MQVQRRNAMKKEETSGGDTLTKQPSLIEQRSLALYENTRTIVTKAIQNVNKVIDDNQLMPAFGSTGGKAGGFGDD